MKALRPISNGVLLVRPKNAIRRGGEGHKPKAQIELLYAY